MSPLGICPLHYASFFGGGGPPRSLFFFFFFLPRSRERLVPRLFGLRVDVRFYPWGGALTLAIRERGLPGVVTKEPQRWFIAINYSKNWRNPLPSPMASDSRTNSTSENSVVSYHPLNPRLFRDCICWIPLV